MGNRRQGSAGPCRFFGVPWLVFARAIASGCGGTLGHSFGCAGLFGIGSGLLAAFAKKLFLGLQPEFEILAWRTVRLLPEVISQHAGFFKTVLCSVGRHMVHRSVVLE